MRQFSPHGTPSHPREEAMSFSANRDTENVGLVLQRCSGRPTPFASQKSAKLFSFFAVALFCVVTRVRFRAILERRA